MLSEPTYYNSIDLKKKNYLFIKLKWIKILIRKQLIIPLACKKFKAKLISAP